MRKTTINRYIDNVRKLWQTERTRESLWDISTQQVELEKTYNRFSKEKQKEIQSLIETIAKEQENCPMYKPIEGEGEHGDVILDPEDWCLDVVDSEYQWLNFRVGMVFSSPEKQSANGLWIEYQANYMAGPMSGPFLMSKATWEILKVN